MSRHGDGEGESRDNLLRLHGEVLVEWGRVSTFVNRSSKTRLLDIWNLYFRRSPIFKGTGSIRA
jgi:hypothetical protein